MSQERAHQNAASDDREKKKAPIGGGERRRIFFLFVVAAVFCFHRGKRNTIARNENQERKLGGEKKAVRRQTAVGR